MYILDTREIVLSFLACTSWGTRVLDAVVISLSCIVHVVVASWTLQVDETQVHSATLCILKPRLKSGFYLSLAFIICSSVSKNCQQP